MNEEELKQKEKIENEFHRIAEQLVRQGDVDVICDLIDLEQKKQFIADWHMGDGT